MRLDSFKSASTLTLNKQVFRIFRLDALEKVGIKDIDRLPRTLKILLENLLRHEDGQAVTSDDIHAFSEWLKQRKSSREIAFHPGRVLMQDFTGVPAVADLAAMRDAAVRKGDDPETINPLIPVDLIIDHSVQVDNFGTQDSFDQNVIREMKRNHERYAFLRWGQNSFKNLRVVPPGTGICHQVNLEYLAKTVWQSRSKDGELEAYPDTLLGTDSHTTMINGLGILGWGVGGIEAEAAMLGQPVSMLIPEVVGVRLEGELSQGVNATDLVLTITELLRSTGVVGKFVEFFGPGLDSLPLADRATIANMAPEYGATCGYFPIDSETIRYLCFTGRDQETIALVEAYAKQQGLWRDTDSPDPLFSKTVSLDLAQVVPCMAGPRRPQDRLPLSAVPGAIPSTIKTGQEGKSAQIDGTELQLTHGDVVIASITSCTNTSNPSVMLAAGLLAKKACSYGLKTKPWVKTSLAPGSKVVMEYLRSSGLYQYLVELGFDLVGYGCATCIGNSGPLPEPIANAVNSADLSVAAVLSGNRNFEGRIHPQVKASWLASPPLVVAFAIAGTTRIDINTEPLGLSHDGQPVYLRDIWPTTIEINELVQQVTPEQFRRGYGDLYNGTAEWRALPDITSSTYPWQADSSYVKEPPFLQVRHDEPGIDKLGKMRILGLFGDSITTDHISPAGNIAPKSPAGKYLQQIGVAVDEFNSYGSRRGNHNVMMRGTFANIRLRNEMTPQQEGGFSKHHPSGAELPIFDVAELYRNEAVPLIIIAGKEYGSGSSRDWAAKGPRLQGVRVVLAESFERIHRSNLIGMGILPLQFTGGDNRSSLKLDGSEQLELQLTEVKLDVGINILVTIYRADGSTCNIPTACRLDTANEVAYFMAGGILPFVMLHALNNE